MSDHPDKSEEEHLSARGPRLKEIPLRLIIPNLITVLAICAGLTGIRFAIEFRYELAVQMVLIAALLDGIDGRVARLLKASTKFGGQMDSLADIINFGVAPALVLYIFALDRIHSLGWIAAMAFAICSGLRLARFNVMAESAVKAPWQSEFFVGVPAPAGAFLVLAPVYLSFLGMQPTATTAYFSAVYTLIIGALLISRVPVWSGKSGTRIPRGYTLPLIMAVVLLVAILMVYPWQTLVVAVACYLISLPFGARAWQKKYGGGDAFSAPEEQDIQADGP
ncbi:CDP-diacylglycerol--serine O-phosphatidyltransferase [Rhizobium sp. L1K21]|uniref:CDP-diacylglycerol--serine O-phosphatidyltransferase n=1 Tax=Rhizobium sp. L1K21 TaxID=2954933 RepID=UPI00209306B2|nr:CDP-diacylglycerol--serine O-phosphatidyltransferase [Rhizobium sp. L1K21]MCO6186554.1 CDP-diacylglycerol--serine O-phosphatidyltransferase [Rhizobium sp. L1K21]